jgi:transposase InsO family protein
MNCHHLRQLSWARYSPWWILLNLSAQERLLTVKRRMSGVSTWPAVWQFAALFRRVFTHVLGVKQAFTTTYRPQVNGQVERFNQTLADTLAHTVSHE